MFFVFYSAGPRYSEREDMEVNQEGKVILQERKEKYGASFLHRLMKEQKVEMETWICLYTLVNKAPHFHFLRM